MGYLICEKCGGYYELQEGEAADDFLSCECGGTMKYVKNLDESFSESYKLNNMSKCSFCGAENIKDVKFCGSCGKPLTTDIIQPTKNIPEINENYNKTIEKDDVNILAIILGLITAIIAYSINFFSLIILPALFSGIAAGYYSSTDNYKKSILYGTITSLIGISVGYVLLTFIFFSNYNFSTQPLYLALMLLQAIVFGSIGGYIGFYLNKKINR